MASHVALQRRHRVGQGRGRPPQSPRQTRDLPPSPLDLARLAQATYLTIPDLCAYGRFKSKNAAYVFLSRHHVPHAAGRVRRRDFDRAFEALIEAREERRSGRRGRRHAA